MTGHFVILEPCMNAHAATFDADRAAGFVNTWGNSFPAEEVPFGSTLVTCGVPFRLGTKVVGEPDHLECLGARLVLEPALAISRIGFLAFSELGDQELEVTVEGRRGRRCRAGQMVPYWLCSAAEAASSFSWRASHLHYAAGYELNHLLPSLHTVVMTMSNPIDAEEIKFEPNPLVHIVAITLLNRENSCAGKTLYLRPEHPF